MPPEREAERPALSCLYSECFTQVNGAGLSQDGLGLVSVFWLISHCLPHPWPLVIMADLLFLKPDSHSCLYCSLTSGGFWGYGLCYFLLWSQHPAQCLIHCRCSEGGKWMSACMSEPSEAAVIDTAPIEVKTKLYWAAGWTGFCPSGLPTLGIEIIFAAVTWGALQDRFII